MTMRLPARSQSAALAAVLSAFVLAADSPATAQNQDPARANPATSSSAGLILQESEGELRVRRPRGNTGSEGAPSFRIKVDRKYGDVVELLHGHGGHSPGKKIRLHHHPHAEEILFVHRGTGVAGSVHERPRCARARQSTYLET